MTSEIEYTCNNCGHEGHNTRAVPDVPELVRYDKSDICLAIENGYDPLPSDEGEYVRYDQAAAVIAALKSEIYDMRVDRDRALEWRDHDKERAEAAEAKLAQYEAQDPVAWLCEKLDGDDRFSKVVCNPLSVEKLVELGGVVTPLYASPAPCPDLKAENERLREALKLLFDHARLYNSELNNEGFSVRTAVISALDGDPNA